MNTKLTTCCLTLLGVIVMQSNLAFAQPATQPAGISTEDAKAREMLERRLPELKFDGVAFRDVIDFLRDTTSANIFVNWQALEGAGIDRNTPVTARLSDVKFSKALDTILAAVGGGITKLSYTVDEGVITISTAADLSTNTMTRVYDIRDLVMFRTRGSGPTTQPDDKEKLYTKAAKDIEAFLVETVDPESWRDAGGTIGSIRYLAGQFIVTQTPDNHRHVVAMLDQLRERLDVQISVETRFIELNPAQLPPGVSDALAQKPQGNAAPAAFLNERQVWDILRTAQAQETSMLTAPRVTLFSGDSSWVKVTAQRAYLSGYTVVKAQGQPTRFEPQSSSVEHGLTLEIGATTDQESKNVSLHFKPIVAELDGFESIPWPGAPDAKDLMIERPKLDVRELKLFFSIPDRQTALVSGWKMRDGGDKVVYILAKPTIIQPKAIEQPDAPPKQ